MESFREIIIREAKRQGLSCYAIGKLTQPVVRMRAIQKYFAGDADLSGERLQAVCRVLGLELRVKRSVRNRG
ncbi:MAG: hypothetical protein HJJLKODD_00552 [Phycisphaerae bacterium]|nr:hypothetical protein [Phycisphaerae bacterium]